tara:strand:+ start:166 stop:489 length:324 start_codon:yes stop_codon:yes gene_type:complete
MPRIARKTKTRSPTTIPVTTATPFKNPAVEDRTTTKATLALGTSDKATIAVNRIIISTRLIVISRLNVFRKNPSPIIFGVQVLPFQNTAEHTIPVLGIYHHNTRGNY